MRSQLVPQQLLTQEAVNVRPQYAWRLGPISGASWRPTRPQWTHVSPARSCSLQKSVKSRARIGLSHERTDIRSVVCIFCTGSRPHRARLANRARTCPARWPRGLDIPARWCRNRRQLEGAAVSAAEGVLPPTSIDGRHHASRRLTISGAYAPDRTSTTEPARLK